MRALHLTAQDLDGPQMRVNHIASQGVHLLGSTTCTLQVYGNTTEVKVFFAQGVKRLYISLRACKELHMVHPDFPRPPTCTCGGVTSERTNPPARTIPDKPESPPFALTEANVGRLEKWPLEHFGNTTFATGKTPLPTMAGPPHHIHLVPGAKPQAAHTPATIPYHFYDEVKQQLDDDVARGVIEEVRAGEPTQWCARMVVVPKKDGRARRTVDFQPLNRACKRETHHTRTPFDMISSVPKHTFKTVADAYAGYHQIQLDDESKKLTTFITPWGRYRYCRTPMGHCAAQDAFTKRFDDVVANVHRKLKCVDDTLLYDTNVADPFWHCYDLLETCARGGVTLRPDKFRFCRRNVEFAGYHLDWEQYQRGEELVKSITEFQMPSQPSITDIRSWFGLVNQVAPFLAVAPLMEPFRELLKKPAAKSVYWDTQLRSIFEETRSTIGQLASEGLRYYDITRPTMVITDYSKRGLGFVVMQQYCQCVSSEAPFCCQGGWKLALCGSWHLTEAEGHYSTIEGEALAIAWCPQKARLFLLGCPTLTIATDHKSLVKNFGDKELKDITNPRILRLKEKTLMFAFDIKYLQGVTNCDADTLSRYPVLHASPEDSDLAQEGDTEGICRLPNTSCQRHLIRH